MSCRAPTAPSRSACALLCAGLCACADPNPMVAPVLDVPPADSAGYPFDSIDGLRLSVAAAGSEQPLLDKQVDFGDPLRLDEVPFGNDLVIHLSGVRGDVEVAYGRTSAIDVGVDAISIPDPHLYFSRIVTWGPAPAPIAADRSAGLCAGFAGNALLVGGGTDVTTLEAFDLADGAFRGLAATTTPRTGGALASIGDGQFVVVGGVDATGDAVAVVEVIDPGADNAARQVIARAGPRLRDQGAAGLVDGSAITIGGATQTGPGTEFTVTGEAWELRLGAGGDLEAPHRLPGGLSVPRRNHSVTRLGDELGADLLVVGGRDAAGDPLASAELYRPLSTSFELVADAALAVPRWSHTAVRMPGGFILIIGGLTADPMGGPPLPVAELELYDPVQGRFSPAGSMPAGAGLTDQSTTLLPDGRVLIAGGRDASGAPVAAAYIARLDPIDGQVVVSETDSLAVARAGHCAVALGDGTVLVVGGAESADPAAERYNPPSTGRR